MASGTAPSIIVLAGPNGAGKTTTAPALLRNRLGVLEFVNADVIAQGLSGFGPERAAIAAGRVMLTRIDELAQQRVSFAFETTLASRSFAPWLQRRIETGYQFHLLFLWLPSAAFAVERVADRVRLGGHGVPEETIRRRYAAGLRNFFDLYRPLATTWSMHDNSQPGTMNLIAAGKGHRITRIPQEDVWKRIREEYGHE